MLAKTLRRTLAGFGCLAALACPVLATAQVITTIAGNGTAGYSGDGVAATSASLNAPFSIARDAAGNLYIADSLNQRVRKVDGSGVITTIAGTGTAGYSGDGGPATSAMLNNPTGVAVDASGNVYIADQANHRVRMIDTAGNISTYAGTGTAGFTGDNIAANASRLNSPYGVAWNANGLYIADAGNMRVRRVNASAIITTFAGTGVPGFSGDGGAATSAQLFVPIGVTLDAPGNVYIADLQNQRIRKVLPNNIILTVAGSGTAGFLGDGGPATSARISSATQVAIDPQGRIVIADSGNHRIRRVAGGVITTIAGNGTAGFGGDGGNPASAILDTPTGVAIDAAGVLYIADSGNDRIRMAVFPSAPSAPVIGTAVAGDASIAVAFTPAYDGGSPVVEFIANCGGVEISGPSSPIVVTGLTYGVTYSCSVIARNAIGDSPPSGLSNDVHLLATTSTNLTGPLTSEPGTSVTFTATVSGSSPTGSITFRDGGIVIEGCLAVTVVSAQAECTTSTLPPGINLLTADYIGDATNASSSSNTLQHTVAASSYNLTVARNGPGTGLVYSSGPGIDCGADCAETFAPLASVTLNASPTTGSTFAGWSGVVCAEGNNSVSCSFTMNSTIAAIATFELQLYQVSVTSSPVFGIVSSNPAGINCGADCNEMFPYGTSVTLNAAAGGTSVFTNWTGVACNQGNASATCTFVVAGVVNAVVHFAENTQQLSVSKAGAGQGNVTSDLPGISCGAVCSVVFMYGDVVTLTATPLPGSAFTGWSGACTGSGTCQVTMDGTKSVTATFELFVNSPNDFNDDGKSDLLWQDTADGSVQGWLMNGLTASQIAGLLPAGGYSVTHVADLDGDGKADLLIRHTDGTVIGWLMNGLGVSGNATLLPAGSGWSAVKTGDLNGDGKADLIVQHTDGTVVAWIMNGLSVSSVATFVPAGSGWSVSKVADLNGDGKADLLWQHTDGTVQAWLMDGTTATQVATFVGAGSGWSVARAGDFNGDGKVDLLWQNVDGSTQAWIMNGLTVTGLASFTPAGTGWSPVLTGDINGDGKSDLFWEHTSGASQTWLMDGTTATSLATFVPAGTGWTASHLLDLNGDGKQDVLWKHTSGAVQAWLMNGLTITQLASLAPAGTYQVTPPAP